MHIINHLLYLVERTKANIIFLFLINILAFVSCENDIKKVQLYAPDDKKLPSQILMPK